MNRKHLNWMTVGFAALALLVIGMMLMNTIRRPGEIILPDTDAVPVVAKAVMGASVSLVLVG